MQQKGKLDRTFSYSIGCLGLVGVLATVLALVVVLVQPARVVVFLQEYASLPTPSPIVIVAPTQEPLPSLTPHPTSAPLPTATSYPTYTPLPTYTPPPTYTPYPTPTPEPAPPTATKAPTPVVELPFIDDFEDGLDPAWEVVAGDVAIANGRLTTSGGVTLLVGDPSWTNYVVELDSWVEVIGWSNHLLVRVQDADNSVYFRWRRLDSEWGTLRDGATQVVPNTRSGTIDTGQQRIRIVVEGNMYRAYVSGSKLSSVIDDRFPNGRVGINLYEGAQIDNFSVMAIEE